VSGHTLYVNVVGSQTEVGESANAVESVMVRDEMGNDVTHNYQIIIYEGILKISDPEAENGGEGGNFGNGEGDNSGTSDNISGGGSGGPSGGGSGSGSGGGGFGGAVGGGGGGGGDAKKQVLFIVFSNRDTTEYLKIESFGNYDGKQWLPATPYDLQINGLYAASYLSSMALEQSGAKPHKMHIVSECNRYAIPYYTSTENVNYDIQINDAVVIGNYMNAYDVLYYDYQPDARIKSLSLRRFEEQYREFVYGNYLEIDNETRDYMETIIAEQGFTAEKEDIVDLVANYIQNAAKYNLNYDTKMDESSNIVISFLDEYKEGVCRHYATAATLLFRALGIPARYTVGALAELESNTLTEVTADKAHAWVEVQNA
jgi:hypothetical protein